MKALEATEKEIYLSLLKWLPVIGAAVIVTHYAHVLAGARTVIVDYLADTSLFAWVFLYASSRLFFCRLHRALIWYIGAASLDVDLHRWGVISTDPGWVLPLLMLAVGAVLLGFVASRKIKCYEERKGSR
jgi:hypothetical protein